MCGFAYAAAMIVYQIGGFLTGEVPLSLFTVVAAVLLAGLIYLLIRPYEESKTLQVELKETAKI